MAQYSDSYYKRKCFLKTGQVPTQSLIKKTMTAPLAAVYFKSMTPKQKIIAGLEPPLKGGGSEWYIPPADLLEGRAVMRPIEKKYLKKLNCHGIDEFGMRLIDVHRKRMILERDRLITESDARWQEKIATICEQEVEICTEAAAQANTRYISNAVKEFAVLYASSVNKLEHTLFNAAVKRIKLLREVTFEKMQKKYQTYLHKQATMLYDRYTKKLMKEKERLKQDFILTLENKRTALSNRLHDIKVEKHTAIEKTRHFLECRTLACQIYVGLVERQECTREMQFSQHEHHKQIKIITKEMAQKDLAIMFAEKRKQTQQEFNSIWTKKVCHVVKNLQLFVSYCLNLIPEHAEFFINMEKLMLLQLSDTVVNPSSVSIIETGDAPFHTPVPKPHPFFLFCDKRYQTKVDATLCPKHCTSSASQLPAIVVNKRCIYAACDNFTQYADKIKSYIEGDRITDEEFEDDENYNDYVPVKYSTLRNVQELKLENSLLQVLQEEIANLRNLPLECEGCKFPHCFYCGQSADRSTRSPDLTPTKSTTSMSSSSYTDSSKLSREIELTHEREPKWESYIKFVEPKKCDCGKLTKKHLMDKLPAYMRRMSPYDKPELMNYETCSVLQLKKLVRDAWRKKSRPPAVPTPESTTRDVGIQPADHESEYLCTCFSSESIKEFYRNIAAPVSPESSTFGLFRVVSGSVSPTYLSQASVSFAADRAMSLRRLIDQSSEIKRIFKNETCEDW